MMNYIKKVFSVFLLLSLFLIGINNLTEINKKKDLRLDLAEISNIKYGLFNASVWSEKVANIFEKKIDKYELSINNKKEVSEYIARSLNILINEVEAYLDKKNSGNTVLAVLESPFKKLVQNSCIDFNELRNNIPHYADAILLELDKPNSKKKIKEQFRDILKSISKKIVTETDDGKYKLIIHKNNCKSLENCKIFLDTGIHTHNNMIFRNSLAMLAIVFLLFIMNLYYYKKLSLFSVYILVSSSASLLIIGILTPMIEIEAKITALRINLFDDLLVFNDQVLFFQSKSILDIVSLLLNTKDAGMIFVGSLIFILSVLFPLIKIVSSLVYFLNIKKCQDSIIVTFFALRSGKWAMADIMVIAIFMSYIGFNGLVSSQLSSIKGKTSNLEVFTTNGTSLQIGFYMFLAFTILSILISVFIEKKLKK